MNNNSKYILIIDDEALALSYLKDTIEEVIKKFSLFLNYQIECTTNQSEFWKLLEEKLPIIIFLDIQMPKKSGLDIAKEIRIKSKLLGYNSEHFPLIVFTTAYENYGYQAFQVNAIDYVLKPIDEEKIESVFIKIANTYGSLLEQNSEYISINSFGIDIKIPLCEVLYFKADMKYIAVVTDKKEFLINDTLLNLEKKYPKFVKIHRSYLINPTYISRFYRKDNYLYVILKNHSIHLPVSRRQKFEIEKKIDYKTILNN